MSKHRKTTQTEHQHVAPDEITSSGGYERDQALIEVTFTCAICGRAQTYLQLPGNLRTVCPPEVSDCEKRADAERLKRWREKKRAEVNAKQREYRRRRRKVADGD